MTSRPVTISVMPGDFIGPEIIASARRVLDATVAGEVEIVYDEVLASGDAYDACGEPLPKASLDQIETSGSVAILKGPFGGPPAEASDPKWANIERGAILPLRRHFGLFANLRPIRAIPGVSGDISPLKADRVEGVDLVFVRELLGGIYFGMKATTPDASLDTEEYTAIEIRRIAHVAFKLAGERNNRVTLVHKSNVMDSGRFWRQIVEGDIAPTYPDVAYDYRHVDDAAAQLNTNPRQFDVILAPNMFGDILSDQAATIVGHLGFCGSASLGDGTFGLYEPIHGSAPDIAGKNLANPISAMRSAALLCHHTLGLPNAATRIDQAIDDTLTTYTTPDVTAPSRQTLGTDDFTAEVLGRIAAGVV
jgi:3-isopropylmalate dehydrogenase